MRKLSRSLLMVLAGVLLIGGERCTTSPSITGDVDDSGNFFTGTVRSVLLEPVAGCSVTLHKITLTPTGDSVMQRYGTVTDHAGRYTLRSVPSGRYLLMAGQQAANLLGVAARVTIGSDALYESEPCILNPVQTISGRVVDTTGEGVPGVRVVVPGSAEARTDSHGFYSLERVPAGHFDLAFIHEGVVNYMPVAVGANGQQIRYVRECVFAAHLVAGVAEYSFYPHSLQAAYAVVPARYEEGGAPDWYAGKDFSAVRYFSAAGDSLLGEIDERGEPLLLLDDFDDGTKYTLLHPVFANSYWFAYTDAGEGGESVIEPEGMSTAFERGITTVNAFSTRSVSCRFVLKPGAPSAYANIAVNLMPQPDTWADLSAMTSLSFYARGSGTISVRFVSKRVEEYPVDTWGHLGKLVPLTEQWQKHTIVRTDIVAPAGSQQEIDGLGWEDVQDAVRMIVFGTWRSVSGDTVVLHLDDVYLHGLMSADMLY